MYTAILFSLSSLRPRWTWVSSLIHAVWSRLWCRPKFPPGRGPQRETHHRLAPPPGREFCPSTGRVRPHGRSGGDFHFALILGPETPFTDDLAEQVCTEVGDDTVFGTCNGIPRIDFERTGESFAGMVL